MADEVILMQPLHDYDDRAPLLVVEPRQEGMVIPIVDCLTPGFRQRLVWLERIVDDDQVPAAAGQYAADRGRHPAPLRRRRKVMDGLTVGQPGSEQRLVPAARHDAPAIPGHLIGK